MHASTEINVDEVDSKQQATSNAHVDDSMLAFFKYIPTAYNTEGHVPRVLALD